MPLPIVFSHLDLQPAALASKQWCLYLGNWHLLDTQLIQGAATFSKKQKMSPLLLPGVYVADSLSMPVHWYYQPAAIKKQFGKLVDYQPAPERHPGSIMSLSSTGGHGRGDQRGRIIGKPLSNSRRAVATLRRNPMQRCIQKSTALAQM